jgi:hypothetical protein
MGMGLGRHDFGAAIGDAFKTLAVYRYDAFSEHSKLCAVREVSDFQDIHFPEIRSDVALKEIGELGNFKAGSITGKDGMIAKSLRTFGRTICIGRHVVVNDEIGLLDDVFANLGASAARLENQMTFDGLESNPILQDGEPMFSSDLGNDLVPSDFGAVAVGIALEALRNQPLRGKVPSNNRPRFLVVDPTNEMDALKICAETLPNVEVVASPYIKKNRFYLMADPDISPVVHRLKLKGSRSPIMVEATKGGIDHFDGIRFKVRADIGVVPTGRVGIVRGGAGQ